MIISKHRPMCYLHNIRDQKGKMHPQTLDTIANYFVINF